MKSCIKKRIWNINYLYSRNIYIAYRYLFWGWDGGVNKMSEHWKYLKLSIKREPGSPRCGCTRFDGVQKMSKPGGSLVSDNGPGEDKNHIFPIFKSNQFLKPYCFSKFCQYSYYRICILTVLCLRHVFRNLFWGLTFGMGWIKKR